jgi:hypothetical protein
MLPGRFSVGFVVSRTVTLKETGSETLFDASRAVHVIVWPPSPSVVPEAGSHETDGDGSPLSLLVGAVYDTGAPPGPVASRVWSAGGAPIVGFVVSVIVTVND